MLGKAITLVESNLPDDKLLANEVLGKLLHNTGNAIRIGITGVPGVGKSTFIEAFGTYLTQLQKKVAVLTIDPSSQITKGSILGDKTRMEDLAKNPMAFIRPSASGDSIGGVASNTREAMLLCEAAGYEVIIIETVGVGQSETTVKKMVDFFLLLMLAGAGDELQGIKKGIMEMADGVVITKADGENKKKATEAQADYQHALHLFRKDESGWTPKVLISSAIQNEGISEIWKMIERYRDKLTENEFFQKKRQQQQVAWMHESFDRLLKLEIQKNTTLSKKMSQLEEQVLTQLITPPQASAQLLSDFLQSLKHSS
jgi:LAO/AO transport system kinase